MTLLGVNLDKSNARGELVLEPIPDGSTAPDATAGTKGVVQLAGDLGGTAASPTVPGLAGKANTAHGHAIADVTDLPTALSDLAAGVAASANVGIPTYLSATEPAPAGPLLWIKDLGGNAYSLAIKTP